MEETPLEAIPTLSPTKRKINKRFIYLVLAIIVIAIIFFAYKTFGTGNNGNTNQKPAAATPTQEITVTPTSTPVPSSSPTVSPSTTPDPVDKATGLDRSKLSVTVENGSGEAGVAGKGSDFLKGLGYGVTGTDNADNFNYTNVTIQVKSGKSDFLVLLKKDLGFSYTIDSATSDLPDSFSSDALVIIGK